MRVGINKTESCRQSDGGKAKYRACPSTILGLTKNPDNVTGVSIYIWSDRTRGRGEGVGRPADHSLRGGRHCSTSRTPLFHTRHRSPPFPPAHDFHYPAQGAPMPESLWLHPPSVPEEFRVKGHKVHCSRQRLARRQEQTQDGKNSFLRDALRAIWTLLDQKTIRIFGSRKVPKGSAERSINSI